MLRYKKKTALKMTYKLTVFYDDTSFSTSHGGIPSDVIGVIERAMRKRKVFFIHGKNNTCMIDFSKVRYATYEQEVDGEETDNDFV